MTPSSVPGSSAARTDNLALIFQEVLTAIVRLRSNRQELSDAESFRFYMREAIKTAIQEARNQGGYNADDIKMATLALIGFLDESVLNLRNPMFADWPRKPLQEELFGIHMAGEIFFRNLEQLMGRTRFGRPGGPSGGALSLPAAGIRRRATASAGRANCRPSPMPPENGSGGFAAPPTTLSWRFSANPKW